jgi:hypothetical protein
MQLTPEHEKIFTEARRRVTKMDTTWLMDFADQSAVGMQMGLDDWRRLQGIESLTEIWGGLLVLMAVIRELEARWAAELTDAPSGG